jgi:hypothetical protein
MQERALDCGLPGMKAAATGRHDANKSGTASMRLGKNSYLCCIKQL